MIRWLWHHMGEPIKVSTEARLRFAWTLLISSLVGAPISHLTFAAGEPPTVIYLSWGALAITALDILFTADVRRNMEND